MDPDVLGRYHPSLSALFGDWHIERRITDHALGVTGSFTGTGRWTPAGAELAYAERGELSFNGHRGPASRSLIYRGRPDGTVDVLFADGRYFYLLDPRPGRWQARHDCGRDVYELSGRRLGAGRLEEHWRVRGPGKDYEIMTTLVRAEDLEDSA